MTFPDGLPGGDPIQEEEIRRLTKMVEVLMTRAERSASVQTSGFSLFQTTILLEEQVRLRTAKLQAALLENERILRSLRESEEQLRVLHAQVREQSIRDELTGLYNRRFLEETLQRDFLVAARRGHPVSVIMVDVDSFKAINDRFGHGGGDQVLRTFGELLHGQVRSSDTFCRYGGEEFALVLPTATTAQAMERAELIRAALACAVIPIGTETLQVTASFGVASWPEAGPTPQALLEAADTALYAAKEGGRNQVKAFAGR